MKCLGKLTFLAVLIPGVLGLVASPPTAAQQKKPNIIVIFGDDVGYWNISAYNQGMIGYKKTFQTAKWRQLMERFSRK